jgi:uncharacterized protein HemY
MSAEAIAAGHAALKKADWRGAQACFETALKEADTAEAHGQHARLQGELQRLAHAEVGSDGKRGHQLGEAQGGSVQ